MLSIEKILLSVIPFAGGTGVVFYLLFKHLGKA